MEGLSVDLLPAWASGPSFPVCDDLGVYIVLQLLHQCLVSFFLFVAATHPSDTRKPCADMEVVLARLGATDEATVGEDGRQVVLEIVNYVLPMGGRSGEEICARNFPLVYLLDATVSLEFSRIELLEFGAFRGSRVFLEGGLT